MLIREVLRQSIESRGRPILQVIRPYCAIRLPDSTADTDDTKKSNDRWRSSSKSRKSFASTKKVNTREVDQFGSWDLRMNFPLLEEQSIRRGTPIPQLTIDKVGFCTHQGRREYQVQQSSRSRLKAQRSPTVIETPGLGVRQVFWLTMGRV
jgi:hypothetical protein